MSGHVIAKCPRCFGEVLASGVCPQCTPIGEAVERLRRFVKVRAPRTVKCKPRAKAEPVQKDFLGGQDAALPVGDRD